MLVPIKGQGIWLTDWYGLEEAVSNSNVITHICTLYMNNNCFEHVGSCVKCSHVVTFFYMYDIFPSFSHVYISSDQNQPMYWTVVVLALDTIFEYHPQNDQTSMCRAAIIMCWTSLICFSCVNMCEIHVHMYFDKLYSKLQQPASMFSTVCICLKSMKHFWGDILSNSR